MSYASQLNIVTSIFTSECRRIFGDKLRDVRLFGSYARNDFDDESDINLMVLVDMEKEQARKYRKDICLLSSDLDMRYTCGYLQFSGAWLSMRKVNGFQGYIRMWRARA